MKDVTLSSGGRLFQITAADPAKVLVLMSVLVCCTNSFMVSAKYRRHQPASVETRTQSSTRYNGARLQRHLQMMIASLNNIHCKIGN